MCLTTHTGCCDGPQSPEHVVLAGIIHRRVRIADESCERIARHLRAMDGCERAAAKVVEMVAAHADLDKVLFHAAAQ